MCVHAYVCVYVCVCVFTRVILCVCVCVCVHEPTVWISCLEMQDNEQPANCDCGPYELVQQTKAAAGAAGIGAPKLVHQQHLAQRMSACRMGRAGYGGENALARYDQTAYNTIESQSQSIAEFTYLRLGPTLMQSGNFQTFQGFVEAMANI